MHTSSKIWRHSDMFSDWQITGHQGDFTIGPLPDSTHTQYTRSHCTWSCGHTHYVTLPWRSRDFWVRNFQGWVKLKRVQWIHDRTGRMYTTQYPDQILTLSTCTCIPNLKRSDPGPRSPERRGIPLRIWVSRLLRRDAIRGSSLEEAGVTWSGSVFWFYIPGL